MLAEEVLTIQGHDFSYDLFVNYRNQDPDRSWVRDTLLPRLRAEGLKVRIDYESFRAGAPLVLEMARAVEWSRAAKPLWSCPLLTFRAIQRA